MYLLNGKKLSPGVAFSIGEDDNELQYPANWLDLSTPEDRAAIGIVDTPDPVRPDERFYVVVVGEDGSYSTTPRPDNELIAIYEAELDGYLDAVARASRYDNRFTFAMRAGYPGPYQAEALAFAQWMDACNEQAYALLEKIKSGKAEKPESINAFLALLPTRGA